MIISFSGIDGSGKTTNAGYACDFFKKQGISYIYKHHIRDSFYHIILHNLIGTFSGRYRHSLENGLRGKGTKGYFAFTKIIKKILLLLNLIYFNLRYCFYKGSYKRHLICDRYFFDDIVQMHYLGLAGRYFTRLYEKMIIKPDIIFFIVINPETAYARKAEAAKEYFYKKSRMYNSIFDRFKVKRVIDGSQDEQKAFILQALKRLMA